MKTTPSSWRYSMLLLAIGSMLASCGNSEPEYAKERGRTSSTSASTQSDTTSPDPIDAEPTPSPSGETPDRELIADTGSRSTLGKSRDSAKDLRNQLQGGQDTSPLAITASDEDYVLVGGIRWELPEDWRLAVPQDPDIKSEVAVFSTYGTGRFTFTHDTGTARSVISSWGRLMLDSVGDTATPQTETSKNQGINVTTAFIEGTYTGDGNDKPFYAVRIVAIEFTDGTVVAGAYLAPDANHTENAGKWEQFLSSMSIP